MHNKPAASRRRPGRRACGAIGAPPPARPARPPGSRQRNVPACRGRRRDARGGQSGEQGQHCDQSGNSRIVPSGMKSSACALPLTAVLQDRLEISRPPRQDHHPVGEARIVAAVRAEAGAHGAAVDGIIMAAIGEADLQRAAARIHFPRPGQAVLARAGIGEFDMAGRAEAILGVGRARPAAADCDQLPADPAFIDHHLAGGAQAAARGRLCAASASLPPGATSNGAAMAASAGG